MKLTRRDGRPAIDLLDPDLRLTEPQRAAIAASGEVVVTAGAGAGKTHTLALRYVDRLLALACEGPVAIEAVAVLTFTEKAAAEMTERCHRRLVELVAAVRADRPALDALPAPTGGSLGRHLEREVEGLLDQFHAARIGTFHGFCARVLREFPVESRTPLDTVVLEPVDAAALRHEVLDRTLLAALRRDPEGLGGLLDALGSRRRLLEAGSTALDRLSELEPTLRAHAVGARTAADLVTAATWTSEQAEAWLSGTGVPALRAVERLASPGGPTKFVRDTLRPLLVRLDRPLPADPTLRALSAFGRLREALGALLTDDGALRVLHHPSVLGTKAAWPDPVRHGRAKEALTVLGDRLAGWPVLAAACAELPTRADATLLAALRCFATWILDAAAAFDADLRAAGAVDFGELQRRAATAIREHPEVARALSDRHRALIVDEFQDTDATQWGLIASLRPTAGLFVVGDAKQAIYGFRGGDVTVFRRAADELGVPPIVLPHNFRSRPELIAWFNGVFPHVLAPTGDRPAPFEAPYDPLLPGRPETGGTVSVILGDGDPLGDPEAVAHLVAAELLAGVAPWGDLALHDVVRHPSPPIAVLLRRRTNLQAYEDALRRRGVPYAVAQGVGFWTRPEVVDVVNTLHALATGDPVSLVGALRSPLFDLTDQQLTDLGPRAARFPDRLDDGGSPADPPVHDAASAWRDLRGAARAEPPSALVRRLVARGRRVWSAERGAEPGREEANGARLVEFAAAFDRDGGLAACAKAFLDQVLAGARETEALALPDRARVVLLTVHAAKGLEFPVVLVPELHVPPRPETAALAVGRPVDPSRWELAFTVADDDGPVQRRTRPGQLEAIRRAARAEADAESRRLLYVACTRARDHLVLLGDRPAPGGREAWAHRLLAHLPATTRVRERAEVLALPLPAAIRADRPVAPTTLTDRRPEPRTFELAASSLDAFAACPARWYRRHVLGVPESPRPVVDRATALAGVRGRVLHGLLEDRVTDPAVVARRTRSAARGDGFSAAEAEAATALVVAHLRAVRASPAARAALDAPGHDELGFRVVRGDLAVRGRIDRLYRDGDGHVVLDHKSEAVLADPEAQLAARHLGQLHAYAWAADTLLRGRGAPGVTRVEVLFTATGAVAGSPWTAEAARAVEARLDEVARIAAWPWERVEREALAAPRPCDTCGYRGRGCAGR